MSGTFPVCRKAPPPSTKGGGRKDERETPRTQLYKTKILLAEPSPDRGPAGRRVAASQRSARGADAAKRGDAAQSREGVTTPVVLTPVIEQNKNFVLFKDGCGEGAASIFFCTHIKRTAAPHGPPVHLRSHHRLRWSERRCRPVKRHPKTNPTRRRGATQTRPKRPR